MPLMVQQKLSWTIKKAERWRIDTFELWRWRRLLRVPWTARRSNQSILKVIHSEYWLEGLVLKLKLQYFGHLMWRATRKDPDTGKDGRQEEKEMTEDEMVGWHHWLRGCGFEQALGDSEGQGSLAHCSPWGHRVGHHFLFSGEQLFSCSVTEQQYSIKLKEGF